MALDSFTPSVKFVSDCLRSGQVVTETLIAILSFSKLSVILPFGFRIWDVNWQPAGNIRHTKKLSKGSPPSGGKTRVPTGQTDTLSIELTCVENLVE